MVGAAVTIVVLVVLRAVFRWVEKALEVVDEDSPWD